MKVSARVRSIRARDAGYKATAGSAADVESAHVESSRTQRMVAQGQRAHGTTRRRQSVVSHDRRARLPT
jgi:hypothetical protein